MRAAPSSDATRGIGRHHDTARDVAWTLEGACERDDLQRTAQAMPPQRGPSAVRLDVASDNYKLLSELDRDLLRRTLAVIPGGAQTDTKTPPFRVVGIQPSFFVRGRGAHAQDLAGRWWLDCQMGLAAYVLGYADPAVNAAAAEQLADGTLFSLASPLEFEVAELLLGIFPEFEMVRFAKNGSDATSAAIRIARQFTGRDHIIGCGYHGFQDWSMTLRNGIGGIPSAVRELTHGNETVDLDQALTVLRADPEKYAAFIVDTGGYGLPDRGMLQEI